MSGGCKLPYSASYIHIGCIQSVSEPSYDVSGHMDAPLYTVTPVQVGTNFGKLGARVSPNNIMVSFL